MAMEVLTCMYVDPAGVACTKVAQYEIIDESNELVGVACPDHAETMQLAGETARQVHPIGSRPIDAPTPGQPGYATKPPTQPLPDPVESVHPASD
jgi:hypothetical protein